MEKIDVFEMDTSFDLVFGKKSLITFWADVNDEYPEISHKAFNIQLSFTNTVSVERAFSSYAFIKNMYRNRHSVSSDLRIHPWILTFKN